MYLCGHPGTGKTSSLNYVLRLMQEQGQLDFKPVLFNAMTYPDVRCFSIKLYEKLHEAYFGELPKRLYERGEVDDEDMAAIVEKLLVKISNHHKRQGGDPLAHRIIVIDEVDCFSRQEKAFTMLIKAIVKSSTKNTQTSVIGIANSVDLPFRKKHSAIAMRDCQLLFQPYTADDISSILELKKNKLFHQCVPTEAACKGNTDLL